MANEPERPIEKLLRAAARKRRDDAGAPFDLHPATRRLLHGEVARQLTKPQHRSRPPVSLFTQLWPRFAWSVAILAVLGVAVWTLVQMQVNHKQTTLLAKLEEEMQQARQLEGPVPPEAKAPAEAPPPPVAATPPGPLVVASSEAPPFATRKPVTESAVRPQTLAKEKLASAVESGIQEQPMLATTPSPADQPATAQLRTIAAASPVPTAPEAFADKALGVKYGLAATAEPPAPSAAPASSASRLFDEAHTARMVQRFIQLAQERGMKAGVAGKATAAQPVLTDFEVAQDGHQLRITDRDGSVYTGYLQTPETPRRALSLRTEAPASAPAARTRQAALADAAQTGSDRDQSGLHTYSFHVTGTNRSLKQKVVFTGNFIAPANLLLPPSAATNLAVGGRLVDARSDSVQPALLPLFNSRISGKAIIGSGQALDINAWPSAP